MSTTRRRFLQGAGALIVFSSSRIGLGQNSLPPSVLANRDLDTWIKLDRDGVVSVFTGKCELGQGIMTALAQIVADELDVKMDRIQVGSVDTAHSPDEGRTVGSNSVRDGGSALRLAAAEARQILLENAGKRLGVTAAALAVEDGQVFLSGTSRSISYWELLADGRFNARLGGAVEPKNPEEYRYVGRPEQRLDLPAKFFGESAFIHDISLPEMLHARVVRGGPWATELLEIDRDAVSRMPGVVSIVRDGNFLAVVAEREEQAVNAAEALRTNARWANRKHADTAALPDALRRLPTEDTVIAATPGDGTPIAREIVADYARPFIAHASIAPSASLAHWDGETLTVHSHAQGMYPLRDAIATVTGIERTHVRCVHADGAGCYGHNGADDVACDAALIALAVPNRPIRLLWSRRDEFINEPYGSAMSLALAAGLGADGRIVEWRHEIWSCSHSTRPAGGAAAGDLLAAREKSRPLPLPRVSDLGQPNGGADRNSIPLYRIPKQRIVEHLVLEPPLRPSALRSLGAHANVFAIESLIDEISQSLGEDPIEYRLKHLDDPRARDVIVAARDLAGRADSQARDDEADNRKRGRGIGFARYKNSSTYLAVVADVAVDALGRIALLRAFAAADAGQIVNPDGIKNQIEGGIVQTTSWTLIEQVNSTPDGIESVDWVTYPILRFEDAPRIEVVLLDRPELPFVGAGEAAQGPTAAAIANAVADATGVRLRRLPLRLPSSA